VQLHAERWEEELYFREIKSHLHGKSNLSSHPDSRDRRALAAKQREEVARREGVRVAANQLAKADQKKSALCGLVAVGADLIPP